MFFIWWALGIDCLRKKLTGMRWHFDFDLTAGTEQTTMRAD